MDSIDNQFRLCEGLYAWLRDFSNWLITLGEWLNTPFTLGGVWFIPEFEITPFVLVTGVGITAIIVVAVTKIFLKWW